MKLGNMTLEDSRGAELIIAPVAEKIMKDEETAKLFNNLLNINADYKNMEEDERKQFVKSRVESSKELTKRLIHNHYDNICVIFAALNKTKPSEIKKWKRSEANLQIAEMMNDEDMQSFFMSSDVLVQAVLSAI